MLVGYNPYKMLGLKDGLVFKKGRPQILVDCITSPDVELKFPNCMSKEAVELIKGLTHKVPEKRLGFQNGAKDIKSMAFFRTIDWESF
jgi:hypothetical protein